MAIFEDRIEIENPGLLPFGLTVDEIRRGVSKLRNRVIGRLFHELGLIEQWGSGIGRMTRACEEMGLQQPLLEEVGTHFRVTFSTRSSIPDARPGGTAGRILDLLADDASRSTAAVAASLRAHDAGPTPAMHQTPNSAQSPARTVRAFVFRVFTIPWRLVLRLWHAS